MQETINKAETAGVQKRGCCPHPLFVKSTREVSFRTRNAFHRLECFDRGRAVNAGPVRCLAFLACWTFPVLLGWSFLESFFFASSISSLDCFIEPPQLHSGSF